MGYSEKNTIFSVFSIFFDFFRFFFGFFGFFYKKFSCIVILRKELFTCIYIYLIYTAGCPEYRGYFFFFFGGTPGSRVRQVGRIFPRSLHPGVCPIKLGCRCATQDPADHPESRRSPIPTTHPYLESLIDAYCRTPPPL